MFLSTYEMLFSSFFFYLSITRVFYVYYNAVTLGYNRFERTIVNRTKHLFTVFVKREYLLIHFVTVLVFMRDTYQVPSLLGIYNRGIIF